VVPNRRSPRNREGCRDSSKVKAKSHSKKGSYRTGVGKAPDCGMLRRVNPAAEAAATFFLHAAIRLR
jgi:hypothetical protein